MGEEDTTTTVVVSSSSQSTTPGLHTTRTTTGYIIRLLHDTIIYIYTLLPNCPPTSNVALWPIMPSKCAQMSSEGSIIIDAATSYTRVQCICNFTNNEGYNIAQTASYLWYNLSAIIYFVSSRRIDKLILKSTIIVLFIRDGLYYYNSAFIL